MSTAIVVANLAKQINSEHDLAQQAAETAVQHAVQCGERLLAVKAKLKHGEFMPWIAQNCKFEQATANRYMTAARQISTGVGISSLRALFPSGRIAKADAQPGQIEDHDHDAGGEHHGGEHHVEHGADDGDAQRPDTHGAGRPLPARVAIDGIKIPDAIDKSEGVQTQVFAALLDAWDGASRQTKENFLIHNAAEIRNISKRWRLPLKTAEGR